MKEILNFCLNISIIFLGVVIKDIFQLDAFLYFLVVFWLYLITNTFVNKMHLTKEYIVFLLFVSIIYTFASYKLDIEIFATTLQLASGTFLGEVNKYFLTEEEFRKPKKRICYQDLVNHNLV